MRNLFKRFLRNRRGSVLAVAAVFLPATLGVMALAIDLSMMFQAHVQAQRAADSAALAGASAYLETNFSATTAENRAREYAGRNDIRGTLIEPDSEVVVQLRVAQRQVYVHVHRDDIPTWFARFLGISSGNVSADAVAEASDAGVVDCLRPLAIPGYWDDFDNDTNGNNAWDYDESWEWDPVGGDVFDQETTDWGTDYRDITAPPYDGDAGRRLIMKPPNGNSGPAPGWFYPIRIGDNEGANDFSNSFTTCEEGEHAVGDSVDQENGAMVGPTRDGILAVIDLDPGAVYNESTNSIDNSNHGDDWRRSPRMLLLAIFDPNQIPELGGNGEVIPTGFAYFFVEGFWLADGTVCTDRQAWCSHQPVVGRFMYYAQGIGGGPNTSTLIRQIRLVE